MSRLLMRCSLTAGSFHQLILLLCASAHGVEASAGFGEDVLRGGEDTAGPIDIWVLGYMLRFGLLQSPWMPVSPFPLHLFRNAAEFQGSSIQRFPLNTTLPPFGLQVLLYWTLHLLIDLEATDDVWWGTPVLIPSSFTLMRAWAWAWGSGFPTLASFPPYSL